MIVYEKEPLTLIGGGELGESHLARACSIGGKLIAADGGANAAILAGFTPDAVIGDFDSINEETKGKVNPAHLHYIAEQDSTDFDKCLRNIDAPLILAIGFTGARIDHQLANFNTLVRYPQKRCILLGNSEIAFLCPPTFSLNLASGAPVSLFPFGAVEGVSDGLRWPIQGISFAPDGRVGTSNEATGPISISLTTPKMLLILPSEYLEETAEAIIANAAHWPV